MQFLKRLFKYFKICYSYVGKYMFLLVILNLSSGILGGLGLTLIFPLLTPNGEGPIGEFITAFFDFLGMEQTIANVLLLMLLLFSFKGLLSFLQETLAGKIVTDVGRKMRQDLVMQYSSMDYTYYTTTNIGHLNDVVTKEVDITIGAVVYYCRILTAIIYIGIYMPPALIINFKLSIVLGIFAGIYLLILRPLTRLTQKASKDVTEQNIEMNSLLIQVFSRLKYIKATNSFVSLHKKLKENIRLHSKFNFLLIFFSAIVKSIMEPFTVLLISMLIYIEVVIYGKAIAEILVFIGYLYKALGEILSLQIIWQAFSGTLGGVEAVEKIRQKIAENTEVSGGKKITSFEKSITFSNVNFSYGDKQILKDINIAIEKNSCIGVVGASGEGKTTLFDLLTTLVTAQSGKISIDGMDYSEIDKSSLRSLVGYVTQDPVMFHDTVANNISLWDCTDDSKLERVKKVAEIAYCTDFIEEMEKGYDTIVGDDGIKLSGGQKQRLAIARELYKEPKIMIFDEATSALDSKSEQHIQQSINAIKGSCTLVIISHRLSSVYDCDRIYVLSNKTVVEQGHFKDLYADKNSLFYQMCATQNVSKKSKL